MRESAVTRFRIVRRWRWLGVAIGLFLMTSVVRASDGRVPIVEPPGGWPVTISSPGSYYMTDDVEITLPNAQIAAAKIKEIKSMMDSL